MEEEIIRFFNKQYASYKASLSEDDAVEFAFFDLKKKYGGNLELSLLNKLPRLYNYLLKHPKGEKSYFHFGKQNSTFINFNWM